jgi:hypothetical protein
MGRELAPVKIKNESSSIKAHEDEVQFSFPEIAQFLLLNVKPQQKSWMKL